jgi:carbonic anhydrase
VSTIRSLLVALVTFAHAATAAEPVHWDYQGEHGPGHWVSLSAEFSACAGKNQSPVDLLPARMIEAELQPISFDYRPVPLDITNNGHTIQVNCAPGSGIAVEDGMFGLKQFHFHSPSENRVDGEAFPLEAHFVHADSSGQLAVVAVMFQVGDPHGAFGHIWEHMPREAGTGGVVEGEALDPLRLLPENRDYYRFNGSLTTPPCTEGVRWYVMKAFSFVGQEQLDAFRAVMHHDNNRPVQPINARPVLK